jgi:hypothetical protein
LGRLGAVSVDQERTSPVRLSWFIALDPHAENGGGLGRKRSIRRRISANRARHRYLGQLEHHHNNYRGATLAPTLISLSRRSRQRPKALFYFDSANGRLWLWAAIPPRCPA